MLSPLNAIIDDEVARRAGWTMSALADAFLAGGARFLQIRCKHASQRGVSRDVRETSVARARAAGADGHRQRSRRRRQACRCRRRPRRSGRPASRSGAPHPRTRRPSSACPRTRWTRCAPASGCRSDYIAVGPVFGTNDQGHGISRGRDATGAATPRRSLRERGPSMPIVAIGGITLERARRRARCRGGVCRRHLRSAVDGRSRSARARVSASAGQPRLSA